MNIRRVGSKSKSRSTRSNSKLYSLSPGSAKLLTSPNSVSTMRGKSKRVLRTLSKMSKGMKVTGGTSGHLVDDKRCLELFEQFSSHKLGYPLASVNCPPSIYFDSLQSKLLDLDQVRTRVNVSMKKRKKSPRKLMLILKNSTLKFTEQKSKKITESPMLASKKFSKSGNRLGNIKIFELFSPKQRAKHGSEISLSLFYDLIYNPSRPAQFRIRFYRNVTQFKLGKRKVSEIPDTQDKSVENDEVEVGRDEKNESQVQFYSMSIRFQDKESCEDCIVKILKSIVNLILFIKSLIEQVTEMEEMKTKEKEDKEKVVKYGRCLLDLSFWMYGYESSESLKMIDVFIKFLEKANHEDFEDELSSWKEAREEISLIVKKGDTSEQSKGFLSVTSARSVTEEGMTGAQYINELKRKVIV